MGQFGTLNMINSTYVHATLVKYLRWRFWGAFHNSNSVAWQPVFQLPRQRRLPSLCFLEAKELAAAPGTSSPSYRPTVHSSLPSREREIRGPRPVAKPPGDSPPLPRGEVYWTPTPPGAFAQSICLNNEVEVPKVTQEKLGLRCWWFKFI